MARSRDDERGVVIVRERTNARRDAQSSGEDVFDEGSMPLIS
jgi:hypothetical protein